MENLGTLGYIMVYFAYCILHMFIYSYFMEKENKWTKSIFWNVLITTNYILLIILYTLEKSEKKYYQTLYEQSLNYDKEEFLKEIRFNEPRKINPKKKESNIVDLRSHKKNKE